MLIEKSIPLANRTTIKIGGIAPLFCEVLNVSELTEIFRYIDDYGLSPFVLGNGSNTLICSLPRNAVVLQMVNRKTQVVGDRMYAHAGCYLPRLAALSLSSCLSGLEWAVNVPGSLGGSIVMNAGAFGMEMIDILESVVLMNYSGQIHILHRNQIDAGHRWTNIDPSECIVLGAIIKLVPSDRDKIRSAMDRNRAHRRKTQPTGKNLGSTFRRHYDVVNNRWISAGYLIDQCGLKGAISGGAQISDVHANFIQNSEGATCADVLSLMKQARDEVYNRFNYILKPEIHIWASESDLAMYGF